MGKPGRPPRTTCRHCGEGGELVKGAHVECRNDYYRRIAAEKRPPAKCRRCNVAIEDPNKLCDQCRVICRREVRRRYERNRPAESKKRRDRKRPKQPTAQKPRAPKPPKPPTPPRVYVKRERPFAEPSKPVIDQPPTNPRGIEPRRIPPVGAAAMSFEEYRKA